MLQDWGRTAAHFIRDQWACLGFLGRQAGPGQTAPLSDQTLRATLGCGVDALTLLPSGLVLPVLAFMSTALAQVSALCINARKKKHFIQVHFLVFRTFPMGSS